MILFEIYFLLKKLYTYLRIIFTKRANFFQYLKMKIMFFIFKPLSFQSFKQLSDTCKRHLKLKLAFESFEIIRKIKEFEFRKCFLFPFMRENLLILPWDSMSRSFSSSSTFLFIKFSTMSDWIVLDLISVFLLFILFWSFLFIYLSCDSHVFSFWDFSFYFYCAVSTFGVVKYAVHLLIGIVKKSRPHLDP